MYKEANKLKSKTARLEYLDTLRVVLHDMLKRGYSPYEGASVTDKRITEQNQKSSKVLKNQVSSQKKNCTILVNFTHHSPNKKRLTCKFFS